MSDKYGDKYRVHDWVKFSYSEIGEYIDENHSDRPLRNDEIVDLLNDQEKTIQKQDQEISSCYDTIIALTAYNWEFTEHYLYNAKEMPNKKELDKIWKTAYIDAKSKVQSGIRTEPYSNEILREMVKLLKEKGIYPLKIWNYNVDNKEIEEEDSLS